MADMDLKGLAAFLEYAADTGMSEWAAQQLIQSAHLASGALARSVKTNLNTRSGTGRRRSGSRGGGGLAGSFIPTFGVGSASGISISLEVGGSSTRVAGYTRKSKSGKVTKVASHIRRKAGKVVTAGAYSDLPYANIHETGLPVIRKKDKYLTIPLTSDAEMVTAPEFPLDLRYKKHHFRKPNMEMIGFLTEVGSGLNQYILAEWVKLPARYYITKAANSASPKIANVFSSNSENPWVQIVKRGS